MAKGGTATQMAISGLIDDLRPTVTNLIEDAKTDFDLDMKDENYDNIVAGLSQEQKDAFQDKKDISTDMMQGTGAWDLSKNLQRDLTNAAGSSAFKGVLGGNLGGARQEAAMYRSLGDVSAAYQDKRQQDIIGGADMLADVGTAMQQQKQKVLDAPHTGRSRIFSYFNAAPQQTVQTTKGGGK